MRSTRLIAVLALVPWLGASSADASDDPGAAETPPPKAESRTLIERLKLSGFVDAYYSWNGNHPSDGDNFIAGTGSTAKHADAFGLNLAAIDLTVDPAPVGVHLALAGGNGLDVIHASDPDAIDFVYQAYLSYRPAGIPKLGIDAGILPCHAGLEGFYSKDNWTYTRSWMAELSPFYQTGVRVTYQFTDHLSGQFHVMNGWQLVGDNNSAKTLGTQVAWDSPRVSFSVNTLAGPELPDDNDDWRYYLDTVLTVRPADWISIAASADVAEQQLPDVDNARWWGAQGLVRWSPRPELALYLRGERFADPDAGISGFPQRLSETTLGIEYHPAAALILKLEGRRDRSTEEVFVRDGTNGAPDHVSSETLVVLGAVATF